MDERLGELTAWVRERLQTMGLTVHPAMELSVVSGDASFRRYFRACVHKDQEERRFIVMDAPPEKESSDAYIKVARGLEACGLQVPHIYAVDRAKGYLLLSDLGDELYLNHLNDDSANRLYAAALHALQCLQQCSSLADKLPLYDDALLRMELNLFRQWFCEKLLNLSLIEQDHACIDQINDQLIKSALAQPQVCVHRDYHSRNLMVLNDNNPGILDFQDAVKGPITYDLVSLLKDCYIAWPRAQVEPWVIAFAQQLRQRQQLIDVSDEQFLRWFDWMGVQRHLKVLGIFSRLHLRDHKPRYLQDIPLVFDYVLETTHRYDELHDFHQWLKTTVWPHWQLFYKNQVITT